MRCKICLLAIIGFLFANVFIACKKESQRSENEITIGQGQVGVTFVTEFGDDMFEDDNLDAIELDNSQAKAQMINSQVEFIENDGIEGRVTLDQPLLNSKNKMSSSIASNSAALMSVGVKYIVFIYDLNDNYITRKELTVDAGSTSTADNTIVLRGGVAYKYTAVSYNSTTAPIVLGTNAAPTVVSGNNQLVHASGTLGVLPFNNNSPTVPSQPPAITTAKVVFKNQTARLTFRYNFRGLQTFNQGAGVSNDISFTISGAADSDVNPFRTGVFNVKTGEYTSHANYAAAFYMIRGAGSSSVLNTNLNTWSYPVGGQLFNDNATAVIYTSEASVLPSLYMRIKKLVYYRENGNSTGTLDASTTDPVVLSFPSAISLIVGTNTRINYELAEPAVTVPPLNIRFARGNIYFRGYGTHNDNIYYRQQSLSSFSRTSDPLSRFRFNEARLPERFTMRQDAAGDPLRASYLSYANRVPGDPCTRLYPLGWWKSPSVAQLQALADYIVANRTTVGVPDNPTHQTHLVFPSGGPIVTKLSVAAAHNRLILERSGYGAYNGTAALGSNYTQTAYSTSATGDSGGYYWAETGNRYLHIRGVGATLNATVETATNNNTTMNIRCVRSS